MDAGAWQGVSEGIRLRRGERYARVRIGGRVFDMQAVDPDIPEGAPCAISIDPAKIHLWPRDISKDKGS